MKNKKNKDDNCVDSILKLTKNVVQNTYAFHNFYIHKNNKLFSNQLPLLTQSKSTNLIINNTNKNKNNKLKKQIPFPLKLIRNVEKKSNKIPKLYSINNNKREVISLNSYYSQINSRNSTLKSLNKSTNSSNSSLGSFPIKIKKKSISLNNKTNNSFDEFQKDYFYDFEYRKLNYNENEIFKNKERYNKLINDKILNLMNEKVNNKTLIFKKTFFYDNNKKKLELNLQSLQINFENLSFKKKNNNNKDLELICPFEFLPLFYYKGYSTFKKLLSLILKLNDKEEKISIDENSIYYCLKNMKEFSIFNNNTNNNNNDKKKKELPSINLSPIIPSITHLNSFQTKFSHFNSHYEKQKEKIFILHPYNNKKKNINKYNYYSFIWTTLTKTYKVTITLPLINIFFPDNSVSIKHFIDFELLFYLYEINFENWDFYITKYLSCFKKIRFLMEKLNSHNCINNQIFFLREPKTKFYSFSQETLFNIHTDENNNNEIIKLKSFYIIVTLSDLDIFFEKEYHIYFSFSHLVKLIQIGKYINKFCFLLKFIDINKDERTISFNYKKLDEFDVNLWIKNIENTNENYFEKKIQSIEKLTKEYDLSDYKLKIELRKPIINIIKNENNIQSSKNYHITKDIEDELVFNINNKESINWSKLINGFLSKMIEIISFIPHSLSSSPPRKKISKNTIVKKGIEILNNHLNITFQKNKKKENGIFLFNDFHLNNLKLKEYNCRPNNINHAVTNISNN